jgi:hypothetical protein
MAKRKPANSPARTPADTSGLEVVLSVLSTPLSNLRRAITKNDIAAIDRALVSVVPILNGAYAEINAAMVAARVPPAVRQGFHRCRTLWHAVYQVMETALLKVMRNLPQRREQVRDDKIWDRYFGLHGYSQQTAKIIAVDMQMEEKAVRKVLERMRKTRQAPDKRRKK